MTPKFFKKKLGGGIPQIAADLSAPHGTTGVRLAPQLPQGPASGGLSRILRGAFGVGNLPSANLSAEVAVPLTSPYRYYEADLFTPGTQNWAFEYPFEYPLQTLWGNAFLRTPNTFSVRQPKQSYQNPYITQVGIGGLVAGQLASQPLLTEESPFV